MIFYGSRIMVAVFLVAFTVSAFVSTNASADADRGQWTQWRGENRDGWAAEIAWPDSIGEENLSVLWKTELTPGYSGPLVAGERVYVAESAESKTESLKALDRKTGEVIWTAQWEGTVEIPFMGRGQGDWVKATPAYDGKHVYMMGMEEVLYCLDAETGEELWSVDFPEKLGTPTPVFGAVSSPMVEGDAVYIQAGGSFVKLNGETGEIAWKVLGIPIPEKGEYGGDPFSSPVLAEIHGREQFVVQTRQVVAGVDPASGDVLWQQAVKAGGQQMLILTPLMLGNDVFISAYGNKSFCFSINEADGEFSVSKAWEHKAKGYMSSPIVVDNHAYLQNQNRRISCLDLKSGEETWRTSETFGTYIHFVTNGKKILAMDSDGELLLIRANPEKFDVIERRQVSESPTWAHLAVAGDEVYIRSKQDLTAYRWK